MRDQLRFSLVLLAVICFVAFFLGFISRPISSTIFFGTGIVFGISTVLLIISWITVKLIGQRRSLKDVSPGNDEVDERAGFFSAKPAGFLLLGIFLASKLSLSSLVVGGGQASAHTILFLHFLLLVILGGLYSRWAKSAEHVPILSTITVVLADASVDAIRFLGNSSAQFRFGPEIVFFAANRISGRLIVLPLFTVIIWGTWKIFEATRKPAAAKMDLPPG